MSRVKTVEGTKVNTRRPCQCVPAGKLCTGLPDTKGQRILKRMRPQGTMVIVRRQKPGGENIPPAGAKMSSMKNQRQRKVAGPPSEPPPQHNVGKTPCPGQSRQHNAPAAGA